MSEHDVQNQSHEEKLSAYLDGELDPAGVREVEDRLARDAAYRGELQRLERAWNLLDRLPRAMVSDSFSKTTIEMVALAASGEAEAVRRRWPRKVLTRRLAGAAGLVAAGLVGFVIGHRFWPDPNETLLRDLPVLENFELYYQADNLDFLRKLEEQGLFAEGDSDHGG